MIPGGPRTVRVRKTVTAVARPVSRRKDAGPESGIPQPLPVSHDELRAMVARGAYLRAERRGFAPGHEVEDWLQAEAEILRSLGRQAGAGTTTTGAPGAQGKAAI